MQGRVRAAWVLLLLAGSCILFYSVPVVGHGEGKAVHAVLTAGWVTTPFLLEASEFLAEQGDHHFWSFVANGPLIQHYTTDQSLYAATLEAVSHTMIPDVGALFKLSLSLHTYSPKIELYRQLLRATLFKAQMLDAYEEREIETLAMVGEELVVHLSDLEDLLQRVNQYNKKETPKQSENGTLAFDHVFPGKGSPPLTVFLYGRLGTTSCRAFHELLAQRAEAGLVRYVFRHAPPSGSGSVEGVSREQKLMVQGYGVELAIKNTEYKLYDTTAKRVSSVMGDLHIGLEDTEVSEQPISGFYFGTLLERAPQLQAELQNLREELLQNMSEEEKLRVWELKDMGFQTSQRIVQASDPLRFMRDISQNLPVIASSLSRISINDTIREEIESNQKVLRGYGLGPGSNLILLNGREVSVDDLNIFSIVKMIQEELRLVDTFTSEGLTLDLVKQLISTPESSPGTRVDARSPQIVWMNNLEVDARYKDWSQNVEDLLLPTWPGQLRFLAKNLYNFVFVLNPATDIGLSWISALVKLLGSNAPGRFAVLLTSRQSDDGFEDSWEQGFFEHEWERLENVVEEATAAEFSDASHGFHRVKADSLGLDKNAARDKDVAKAVIKSFAYALDKWGTSAALRFLRQVVDSRTRTRGVSLSMKMLEHAVRSFLSERRVNTDVMGEMLQSDRYASFVEESDAFVRRIGLSSIPCALLNGKLYEDQDLPNRIFMLAASRELQTIRPLVASGTITNDMDIYETLLTRPTVFPRYNRVVFESEEQRISLWPDRSHVVDHGVLRSDWNTLSREQRVAGLLYHMPYVASPKASDTSNISLLVIADLETQEGVRLLAEVLHRITRSDGSNVRFSVISNSGLDPSILSLHDSTNRSVRGQFLPLLVTRVVVAVMEGISTQSICAEWAIALLRHLCALELVFPVHTYGELSMRAVEIQNLLRLDELPGSSEALHFVEEFLEESDLKLQRSLADVERHRWFSQMVAGVSPGNQALIANGRVVNISGEGSATWFTADDVALLEEFEMRAGVRRVSELIPLAFADRANLIARMSSFLSVQKVAGPQRIAFPSAITLGPSTVSQSGQSAVHLVVVADPLSPSARKLAPILMTLRDSLDASYTFIPNPVPNLSELPLRSFYRYVLSPELTFGENGSILSRSWAIFTGLPTHYILTMKLDVPEPWVIEPIQAVHDLDNILLQNPSDEERIVSAQFELVNILVTGSCVDVGTQQPADGLQLVFGNATDDHVSDTIVMRNLGYFQVQANPGIWDLTLAKGRARDIYSLLDGNRGALQVAVSSFGGERLLLKVMKRKGKESMKLLDVDSEEEQGRERVHEAPQSLWGSLVDKLGLGEHNEKTTPPDEVLNVFSIASGHLYERFIKIMMLSVLRHTKNPVKFWFLKNYMSPKFKNFIPYMAKKYGFQYQLVTYKWPSWLRRQEEKMREIWGYKILFLDVLFPLHVKKIIFVDADQAVRADLKELTQMDLHGAPYGYTPFCDNRKEIEGFRFWKSGYWKDHLRGKPYHISALYVVDLQRFRRIAAGDHLRVFYDTLSKDPNSLSNLDQDLPNYAQHMVRIFSLPQEWLWCETWCSDESKKRAKTIDLCNNPMTKEPKMEAARRIIGEWDELDQEARATEDEFDRQYLLEEVERMGVGTETSTIAQLADRSKRVTPQNVEPFPHHPLKRLSGWSGPRTTTPRPPRTTPRPPRTTPRPPPRTTPRPPPPIIREIHSTGKSTRSVTDNDGGGFLAPPRRPSVRFADIEESVARVPSLPLSLPVVPEESDDSDLSEEEEMLPRPFSSLPSWRDLEDTRHKALYLSSVEQELQDQVEQSIRERRKLAIRLEGEYSCQVLDRAAKARERMEVEQAIPQLKPKARKTWDVVARDIGYVPRASAVVSSLANASTTSTPGSSERQRKGSQASAQSIRSRRIPVEDPQKLRMAVLLGPLPPASPWAAMRELRPDLLEDARLVHDRLIQEHIPLPIAIVEGALVSPQDKPHDQLLSEIVSSVRSEHQRTQEQRERIEKTTKKKKKKKEKEKKEKKESVPPGR